MIGLEPRPRPVANPACAISEGGGVPGLRKIDIQSWVLIRPFSTSFGPRTESGNPSDEKRRRLAHFEAPELSCPIMMFPEHFWNLQNREISVPGAPIFQISRFDF